MVVDWLFAEPIPTFIEDAVTLDGDEEFQAAPLNFPNRTPRSLVHQTTFVARHGFYFRFETKSLRNCPETTNASAAAVTVRFSDIYNADSETQLCLGYSKTPLRLESFFHTFKLRYEVFNGSVSSIFGRIIALPGKLLSFFEKKKKKKL